MTTIMERTCFVLLSVIFSTFKGVSTADLCLNNESKGLVTDGKLGLFPLKFFYNIGPTDCYNKCVRHSLCRSVNYDRFRFYCELLRETKTKDMKFTNTTRFIHMELNEKVGKKCGDVSCNHYSTCIILSSETNVCVETECFEGYPVIENGFIEERQFSPITASYTCSSGYTGVGDKNVITCKPGGKWSPLLYRCEPPVDGGWSEWSNWGACSLTCGDGWSTRLRDCNNPTPQYGGSYCQGGNIEHIGCNIAICPIHGGWGHWSDWSYCTAHCRQYGVMSRYRQCNNPQPMYGGLICIGPSSQEYNCYNPNSCY